MCRLNHFPLSLKAVADNEVARRGRKEHNMKYFSAHSEPTQSQARNGGLVIKISTQSIIIIA